MNAQEISIRHSALGWVKKSIDDNLSEIKSDLSRYVESNEQGLLEAVKRRLIVIRGVLVMIEQYGAAMLTEEMAALVDFIVVEKESKDDQALEVLLRAVLQLPDYLEHIQSGHHDIPIAILPLLNDVRAVRNQDLFSEKLLFLPDLSMHEDAAEIEAIDDASNQASRLLVKKLRPVYQLALVNVIRERSVEESLKRLEKICEALEERSVSEQIARIWWIVGALIESVARQHLELGVSIKNLLGKVDALFRVILIIGERGLLKRQPIELIKNFLYYVAQPECDGPKAQAIKTAYRLEQFLPSESARSEVLNNIAGPNQALLKTVAETMKAEIETIKSTLEIYVNGDLSKIEALKDLPQEMHIISDTLAMIGLGAQRQLIESQIKVVKNILAVGKAVDEEQLLSMAAELLQVEQALDQMSKRQSNRAEQPRTESDVSRDYELDSVLAAVVAAALDDIQKTKTAILEFVKDPERSDNIDLCITLMLESRGAMQLLEQHRAVTVVDGLLKYLRGFEVSSFMESARLDALSQVVVSLEYFLEALGEHRSDASSILDVADQQLQQLPVALGSDSDVGMDNQTSVSLREPAEGNSEVTGTAPAHGLVAEIAESALTQQIDDRFQDTQVLAPDVARERLEQPWARISTEPDAETDEATQVMKPAAEKSREASADAVSNAEQMEATVVMSAKGPGAEATANHDAAQTAASSRPVTVEVEPVNDTVEVLKSGSDPEILEIYLEEAEEEASNIVRLQKDWMLHPEDENALKNIRRAFHTIKGSGRLVGALKIAEFAWDYEQLLNCIIDKTVPPERPVINAVGKAGKALTELVHELKTFEEPSSDIPYLRGLARALAKFDTEELLIDHTQTMSMIESPYDRITDTEEDKDESGDDDFGVTTQLIETDNEAVESRDWTDADASDDQAPSAIREEVQAAPAAAADYNNRYDDTVLTRAPPVAADINRYDDTVLTPAPPVPSMDDRRRVEAEVRAKIAAVARARAEVSYQRATDYTQASEAPQDDDVDSSPPPVPAERESGRPAAIEIESMGDDFLGEGLIDNSEAAVMEASFMQTPVASMAPAETTGLLDIEFEELTLPGDNRNEAIEPGRESSEIEMPTIGAESGAEEIEMQALEEEPEAEEIEIQAFEEEPETEDIEIQALEEEPGAEEIEMQALEEEPETENIEIRALEEEYEAEEIEMQTPAEEFEAEEIEFEALEDSIAWDDVDTSSAKASSGESTESEIPADRGDPPDPFVLATTSPTPGVAAEDSETQAQGQLETTGLSFDPELLTIYQQEVEQHLDTVSSALDSAEKIRELIPGEDLYRALHTIHGASRTADITTIGELASLLEKPLKMAIAQKMALDHEIVALYREGQRALHEMTAELVSTRQMPDIPTDLKISLQALAADFEEHTVDLTEEGSGHAGDFVDTLTMMNDSAEGGQDLELLAIFIDEANELLEMSDDTLHQWSQQRADDPGAQDYHSVMELQRYLHTLKGGARMAELKEISDLSHEMESLFIAVIDGRVEKSGNLIEMLKDSFDLLHRQVNEAQQGDALSSSSEMVEALKWMRQGEGDQDHENFTDESADFDPDREDIDIVSENLPGDPLSMVDRSAQDVVKVRADLLDNLVSSAGEVSIYRARMEQQVAGLGSHLGELGQTITRLKAQLRSLEAETDAQIHFSHRTESTRPEEFDPLEMDRYTLIQELSRSLSESVNDLSSLQNILGEQVKDSETLLLQQSRVSTDLQDGLIKSRMVKFSGLLSRLRRLVRQSSQELGKKAELSVTGEQNEVDNKVLDRMVAPLEHIIRNALSHGIETPVERVKKGKPEAGHIAIDITRDGSDVVIKVSDDGAGVDIEKVRSRAIQLGLLEKGRVSSESDLVQYILEPGFSTAEHVTQLSGRGVGMDVVDVEVKQLGGTLQIETTPQGTTFIARLPFTLSINQAILARCGDETYAIPLPNIEGITRIEAQQMHDYYREDAPQLEYAGQNFELHSLARLVGTEPQFRAGVENEKQPVILSRAGDLRIALHVDEIIGNREIVVKTLGKQLSQVKSLAGASILADGSVVLILDIGGLIRHNLGSSVKIVYKDPGEAVSKLREMVMVVDDSITMRRVATKLLERHNYEVITAKDGVDALAQLQDLRPDVMLLDVEMPRMDGFELATHLQNEESLSSIPIIMITSRTGEKHRDRALEIGITNYMGKPYQEEELIRNIQSALDAR